MSYCKKLIIWQAFHHLSNQRQYRSRQHQRPPRRKGGALMRVLDK